MKKLLLIFLTCFFYTAIRSQVNENGSTPIDVADIHTFLAIQNNASLFIDSNNLSDIHVIKNKAFLPLTPSGHSNTIPSRLINKKFFYQFLLKNSGPAADTIFLCPGYLFKKATLFFEDSTGNINVFEQALDKEGFIRIPIASKEVKKIFVRLSLAKVQYINLAPDLINKDFLADYKTKLYNESEYLKTFNFFLSGILFLMLLYSAVNFLMQRRKEYLYYFGYALCMFFLVLLKALFRRKMGSFSIFFVSYFDFALLIIGTVFYIAFTRFFLNTKNEYTILDKLFRIEEKVLFFLLLVYTALHYFTDLFWLEKILENGVKILALALGIVYIALAFRQKDRYTRYLAYGNTAMIFFSCISFILIIIPYRGTGLLYSSFSYYNIGMVTSLIFFLLGLTHKNTRELIEKTQKAELMKQEERDRISADMHDDLGAGVTSIRLYSELAKHKMGLPNMPEIDKISSCADELLDKMNAIIWSMSSNNDTFESLIAYIRYYALNYFENTGIECIAHVPENLPQIQINGETRRNIFLVVKEALNNILKHAKATKVEITLKHENNVLELSIHDNGIGIDFENIKAFGNGMKNMQKRMKASDIDFSIENQNGTLLKLRGQIKS